MIIQCNGLFPRADKNGVEQIGGVIERGTVKYWARANVAQGTLSLSLSVMREEGGFTNAGVVAGKNRGSGIFTFLIDGDELTLAVRKVQKDGKTFKAGTLFLGSIADAKQASQADLAAFITQDADEISAPVAEKPKRSRAPRQPKAVA